MPSTKLETKTTPTVRHVALLTLLAIAAVLGSSCRKEQGPTPGPNPAKEGETIIVIKGGSVEVGFDESKYVSDNNPNPKYECASCKFSALEVGPDEYNLTPCPISDQNSTIHIKAGGQKKDINIKRNPNPGRGIVIDFDKTEYGPDSATGKKHYNKTNTIDDVKITPPLCCACPDTGNCYIRIRTSY